MPAEQFDFFNSEGQRLAGLIDNPVGEARAYALFAHCFTCGKHNRAARHIADGLKQRGIAVLRFDFTGLGASEGEFANTTFSSNVDDLLAAADHLRQTLSAPALTSTVTAPLPPTLPETLIRLGPSFCTAPLEMRTG